MYPLEDRMRAVQLFLKYDRSSAAVRRELGYPSKGALRKWVAEYEATGTLHDGYRDRSPKYSDEQKRTAVNYYLEHGRNIRGTVRALGYPNRETLRQWLDEAIVSRRHLRTGKMRKAKAKLTNEEKQAAIIDLCSREGRARDIAERHGVTRAVLYKWRNDLLGKERPMNRPVNEKSGSSEDRTALESQVESLQQQVGDLEKEIHRLQLERDVLTATAEILKKDQGADPTRLSNREKATVIGALREKYVLSDLLRFLAIAKSSYFYQHATMSAPDKLCELRERVHTAFLQAKGCYGYRRIHAVLTRDGVTVSEKVVRRVMREENLVVLGRKRRKYNSYKGEISPAVPNIIERDFHADAPNVKWLTDLTEFHIPAGKVYLSPIVDCFDGMVVSWSIGTNPNANMVNSMLDHAISTLKADERPLLHSDRGAHYRWPGWIERMQAAGLVRSMSKKGCTADNAACEGFFGRIKNEMFYGRSWRGVSIKEFINILDRYLRWYNERRIKMSLGAKSPTEYRQSLNCA